MLEFAKYQDEINRICQKYQVKNLTVFGSAITEAYNKNSDIDFLIELNNSRNGIKRYINIKKDLEKLFNRSVDLVMPKAIKNKRLKEYILSNKREVYAA